MMRVLAVDAGRTACRLAVYADGRRCASTEVASGHTLADPGGARRVHEIIVAAASQLGGELDGSTHVVAGLAGVWNEWASVGAFAESLGTALEVPEVVVTNDVVAAYVGALGHEPGVVLVAGTGAVALGVGGDGTAARVDGWGYQLGDAGSAHWLGRAGLERALRAHDGRGRPTVLIESARRRHGDLDRIHSAIASTSAPPRTVAAFATDVTAAAEAGDAVAARIVEEAVAELVSTVRAAAGPTQRAGATFPVATLGGLFGAPGPVADRFAARLPHELPAATRRSPEGDALAGAAALAEPAGHLETLLRRWRSPTRP